MITGSAVLASLGSGSAVLAWVQAPHWGKKERKIGVGEKNETSERNEPRCSLGRGFARRYFSYLTPKLPFSTTSETGSRLPPPFLSPVSSRFIFMHVRASSSIPADPTISEPGTGYFRRCLKSRGILPTNSRTLLAPVSFPQKKTCFRVIVILSESAIDHWMSLNCTESKREFSWLIRKKKTWKDLLLKCSYLISYNRLDHYIDIKRILKGQKLFTLSTVTMKQTTNR